MKKQFISLALVGLMMISSLTIFGNETVNDANIVANKNTIAVNLAAMTNLTMEYCSVDLADRNSNLNVRTWEGRVVGKLRHGTSVWVNEYSNEWARISVKRGRKWVSIGWVDSNYLLC